jgi:hypothetical protein
MSQWRGIDFKFSSAQTRGLSSVVQDGDKLPAVEAMLVEATKRQKYCDTLEPEKISKVNKDWAALTKKLSQTLIFMKGLDSATLGVLKGNPALLDVDSLGKYIASAKNLQEGLPKEGRGSTTSTQYKFALTYITERFTEIYYPDDKASYSPTSRFYSIVVYWLTVILEQHLDSPDRQIKGVMENLAKIKAEAPERTRRPSPRALRLPKKPGANPRLSISRRQIHKR